MKYLTILLLILKISITASMAQIDTIPNKPTIVVHDTIYVSTKSDTQILREYQEILEKTNQQLSLWWNPFGVLIGALGILFTILTIISAIIIYRQSKEHREILDESIKKNEAILNKLIEEKNQQLKAVETNLSELIMESKAKLKTATEDNKKEINELISKLEIQRESIDSQISPVYVTPESHNVRLSSSDIMGMRNKPHTCTSCKFKYFVKDKKAWYGVDLIGGTKTVTCPKCGNIEEYYDVP